MAEVWAARWAMQPGVDCLVRSLKVLPGACSVADVLPQDGGSEDKDGASNCPEAWKICWARFWAVVRPAHANAQRPCRAHALNPRGAASGVKTQAVAWAAFWTNCWAATSHKAVHADHKTNMPPVHNGVSAGLVRVAHWVKFLAICWNPVATQAATINVKPAACSTSF